MKHAKKLASLLLALVMLMGLSVSALAAEDYSITVNNPNESISINGNTYYAYKLFNVTYNAGGSTYAYTVTNDFKNFTYSKTVGEETKTYSGEALITYIAQQESNSDEMNAIAEAALKYATENSIAATGSAKASNETATISLTSPGYYLVAGTATAPDNQTITAACALTTTAPTAKVNVKADAPSIDKQINEGKDEDDKDVLVDYNNAAIGDKVDFVVTSKVPDMIGYEKYYFVVSDTLSKGLTFNDDVAITVGNNALTEDTDYTVTATQNSDGGTDIEVVFKNFIQYKGQKGTDIIITYSATVNEDAVIGVNGNPNTVKLTYSSNPNVSDKGTEGNPDKPTSTSPTGETPEQKTYTYVTDLKVIKVDQDKNRLAGAEFKLTGDKLNKVLISRETFTVAENGEYWKLRDGTYTKTAPVISPDEPEKDTSAHYDSIDTKYSKSTKDELFTVTTGVEATGTVDENGELTFTGLSAGTYTITEIKSPSGYNLLKDPVTVTISWTAPTAPATQCTWTYTGTDTEGEGENVVNTNHVTITNRAGSLLPSTGGMGTTIFYVLGSILVLGAGVLLVVKKRMGTKD